MTDLETITLLQEFKEKYFEPIAKEHGKYLNFNGELPEKEIARADKAAKNYHFLSALIASVEGTLEQNLVLKAQPQVQSFRETLADREKHYETHINSLVKQIEELKAKITLDK